jgi:hypothetical protein
MLLLAKALAVVTVVWFYLSAQQKKQKPITWAVIGLIGYVLTWFLVRYTIIPMFPRSASQSMFSGFLIMQIPAVLGFFAVYLVRGKLMHDADNAQETSSPSSE